MFLKHTKDANVNVRRIVEPSTHRLHGVACVDSHRNPVPDQITSISQLQRPSTLFVSFEGDFQRNTSTKFTIAGPVSKMQDKYPRTDWIMV